MTKVIVVIGPRIDRSGYCGAGVGAGKQVLLADLRQENADAAAKTLSEAGFGVTTSSYWFGELVLDITKASTPSFVGRDPSRRFSWSALKFAG